MEVAVIDWKNIDSSFVKDDLYEHINAPKWIDFSDPGEPVDDEAWFCRSSCNHPKAAEDFFNEKETKSPASNSRHQRSASVSDSPLLGDKIKRDATLKKRGTNQPFPLPRDTKHYLATEDGENRDPNYLSTTVKHKAKVGKETIKLSAEKKLISNDTLMTKNERAPKLRSTLSARNLFSGGGDILNKVTEFCNGLKKLASRAREEENADNGKSLADENLDIVLNNKEKERKPLLETSKEKSGLVMGTNGGSSKGLLRRKKKIDVDGENTPPISVDVNKKKNKDQEEALLNIRTCPPTPQCFSSEKGQSKGPTPKPFRTRPLNQERVGILQEVKEINRAPVEKDARSLDVFWFFKPCTLSS